MDERECKKWVDEFLKFLADKGLHGELSDSKLKILVYDSSGLYLYSRPTSDFENQKQHAI